jgi:hypothetical protein
MNGAIGTLCMGQFIRSNSQSKFVKFSVISIVIGVVCIYVSATITSNNIIYNYMHTVITFY